MNPSWLNHLSAERPVLIAGPTATGKSTLALEIAAAQGGVIVNADALQVFANWRVLTARPGPQDQAAVAHALYGHVPGADQYSVGHWLRDIAPILAGKVRPIIVGGTGLYFSALTQGLAAIPETPVAIRALADARLAAEGAGALLAELDSATAARIDRQNPARVQRAWEVLQSTGRGLVVWQDETPAPLLRPSDADRLLVLADRDRLADRISRRFDAMIVDGVLDEVHANLSSWNPALPSSKAIGASDLIAHLRGEIGLADAISAGKTATRQFAKRQRTWFRSKMRDWAPILLP